MEKRRGERSCSADTADQQDAKRSRLEKPTISKRLVEKREMSNWMTHTSALPTRVLINGQPAEHRGLGHITPKQ